MRSEQNARALLCIEVLQRYGEVQLEAVTVIGAEAGIWSSASSVSLKSGFPLKLCIGTDWRGVGFVSCADILGSVPHPDLPVQSGSYGSLCKDYRRVRVAWQSALCRK